MFMTPYHLLRSAHLILNPTYEKDQKRNLIFFVCFQFVLCECIDSYNRTNYFWQHKIPFLSHSTPTQLIYWIQPVEQIGANPGTAMPRPGRLQMMYFTFTHSVEISMKRKNKMKFQLHKPVKTGLI